MLIIFVFLAMQIIFRHTWIEQNLVCEATTESGSFRIILIGDWAGLRFGLIFTDITTEFLSNPENTNLSQKHIEEMLGQGEQAAAVLIRRNLRKSFCHTAA